MRIEREAKSTKMFESVFMCVQQSFVAIHVCVCVCVSAATARHSANYPIANREPTAVLDWAVAMRCRT